MMPDSKKKLTIANPKSSYRWFYLASPMTMNRKDKNKQTKQ
jgi:hypothetical protein